MNQLPRWAQALDIPIATYTTWSASARPGQPALAYALENGLVESSVYLAWAREEYGLASLDAGFFFSAVDVELVRGARDAESYAPWFYPVARWDDVTYVACVEPVEGLPESFCLVLADARAMRDAWTAAGEPAVDPFAEPTPAAEPAPVDMPAGLTAVPKPFSLNLDNISLRMDEPAPTEAPDLAPPEPELPGEPRVPHEDTMLGKSVMFDTDASVMMPAALVIPPPAAPSAPPPAPPALAVVPEVAPKAPTPAARPAASPASNARESDQIAALFTRLNRTYQNACLLRCSDQMARLYKGGANVGGAGPAIDLSYPSFLRIVARTKQPYHGHLIDSPIHREFFQGLGLNDLPACATAAPIIVDDVLWGVLVVTGTEAQRDARALEPVRAAAAELVDALGDTWRRTAA